MIPPPALEKHVLQFHYRMHRAFRSILDFAALPQRKQVVG